MKLNRRHFLTSALAAAARLGLLHTSPALLAQTGSQTQVPPISDRTEALVGDAVPITAVGRTQQTSPSV
jgi:hypothetical protein